MINKDNSFNLGVSWRVPNARQYAFAFIALFIFLIVIYGNSFHCDWHFDDMASIVDNARIHLKRLAWPDIREILYGKNRPVVRLSFALNYYFGGTKVFGYHLVNFVIHYIASVFLFLFIYRTLNLPILKDRYEKNSYAIALVSTFLWASNPVQVSAVTYIVQRMAGMAAMAYIMAMYFYLKGRSADKRSRSALFFVLCAFSAAISFGSKENAAMLLVSLFLYDLFLIQGITKENLKKNMKIIILPLLGVLVLAAVYVDFSSIMKDYEHYSFTLTERLLTEPRVVLFYVTLLLYPINSRLTMFHDLEISRTLFTPWTTLPAIIIILILIGISLWGCRKRPLIAYCILFFFLNHLIEASIIPLEIIYEHRNYLPSMLLSVPVAVFMIKALDYFSYKKSVQFLTAFGFTFLLLSQGHTTYIRNKVFQDELVFWKDNIAKAPDLRRPHNNLGKYYEDRGLYSKALEEYDKALCLNNFSNLNFLAVAHENIGMYYLRRKEYDQTIKHFQESIRIYSGKLPAETIFGLAIIHYKLGHFTKARKSIQMCILDKPSNEKFHLVLSMILLKSGDIDGSIQTAQKALRLKPDYEAPLMILAESFKRRGEYRKSIQYWEDFLKKNPKHIKGHFALIELFSITGKNEMRNKIVGWLTHQKGEKSFLELIRNEKADDDIIAAYVPDPAVLLPIIRESLLDQSNKIKVLTDDYEAPLMIGTTNYESQF